MDSVIQGFFNIEVLERFMPLLWSGLLQTLLLSAIAVPLGVAAGLGLALAGTGKRRSIRVATGVYVDVMRSFPPLVLLILIASGLPLLGLRIEPILALTIALLLNSSAYYGEIFRAGLLSVPKGLHEAARATGLGYWQTALHVRIPLAVRTVLPDLLSNTLELVKLTSIGAVVTYVELTQAARVAQGLSFNATPIIAAAVMYFLLLWPLARWVSRLEQRSLAGL